MAVGSESEERALLAERVSCPPLTCVPLWCSLVLYMSDAAIHVECRYAHLVLDIVSVVLFTLCSSTPINQGTVIWLSRTSA